MSQRTISSIISGIIGLAFALGIVLYLSQHISFEDFKTTFTEVNLFAVIGSFVVYACANMFRVLRFRFLTPQSHTLSFRRFFSIVCIHNFFNAVLPFRLGETAYLYLMKRERIVLGSNAAALLASRLLDLLVIALFFLISVLGIDHRLLGPKTEIILWVVLGALLGALLIRLFIYRVIAWLPTPTPGGTGFWYRIQHIAVDLRAAFEYMFDAKHLPRLLVYSLLIWGSVFVSGFILMRAVGLTLSIAAIMFAYTFPVLSSILPIQFPGGFGSYEAPLAGVLILMDIPKEIAISGAFVLHVIELLFTSFLGLLALVAYSVLRRPSP